MTPTGARDGQDERLWRSRFEPIRARAEQWRTLSSKMIRPERNSSLWADDQALPYHPVSQIVWSSIITAAEHIDFFASALHATRTVRPSGYFPVARTALITSARAVWLLTPPRHERQKRGIRLAFEEARQTRNFANEVSEALRRDGAARALDPEEEKIRTAAQSWAKRYGERMDEIAEVGKARFGLTDTAFKYPPGDTDVIAEAATQLPPDTDPWIRRSFRLSWRTLSGDSHGYRWSSLLRRREVVPGAEDEVFIRVQASLEELVVTITAPWLLTERALELYQKRSRR